MDTDFGEPGRPGQAAKPASTGLTCIIRMVNNGLQLLVMIAVVSSHREKEAERQEQ